MKPDLKSKILIVLVILIVGWLFIRIIRLLIPLVLIAIAVGWIWDVFDNKEKKYDDYEEL
ncbi:MAG: hypothetical protein ACWA41_02690 [Putridiphycobacter sp.]